MQCKTCGVDKIVDRFVNCEPCRTNNRTHKTKKEIITKKVTEISLLSMSIVGLTTSVLKINEDIRTHFYNREMIHNDKDEDCAICLDNINVNESMYKIECNHKFHTHCLLLNSYESNTCPVCRDEILYAKSSKDYVRVYETLIDQVLTTSNSLIMSI
jgi:hypothetical protein